MAKLTSNLGLYAGNAAKAAETALQQTAQDIVSITQQLCPVDTGRLKQSYRYEEVAEGDIIIGTDTPYAPFVEFGTVHSAAQPHLTPAFLQAEETFAARFKQAIENIK